jgi:hypothetical protein
VVDVEDQGKVERAGAGAQGFLQDAVTPDLFERDAVAVSGQVARRYPSQASRALRVSSPRRCRWPAMLMRRPAKVMNRADLTRVYGVLPPIIGGLHCGEEFRSPSSSPSPSAYLIARPPRP